MEWILICENLPALDKDGHSEKLIVWNGERVIDDCNYIPADGGFVVHAYGYEYDSYVVENVTHYMELSVLASPFLEVKKINLKQKMEYIDDLSYSNIVKIIQGEEVEGSGLLNLLSIELEDLRKNKEETESILRRLKSREETILRASQDVAKHIKKELPLSVIREKYIVILSKDNLLIQRNVI